MRLKPFNKNEKKINTKTTRIVVIVFLFVVALVLGRSFALYQKEDVLQVANGVVGEFCVIGQTWDFDYVEDESGNGYEQEFITPCVGNYKLETWGAQGGSYNETYYGGYGAYSVGKINLDKDIKLYINVGGAGSMTIVTPSDHSKETQEGYNGGGAGGDGHGGGSTYTSNSYSTQINTSGGGATHIATESGILSSLSQYAQNHNSPILIVASGGGGAMYYQRVDGEHSKGVGGSGGGYLGTLPTYETNLESRIDYLKYATQTQGGAMSFDNGHVTTISKFGQAASALSGGGGGYYGGLSSGFGGGGGLGYIGNINLTNKVMYCYNCEESNEELTRTISTTNVSNEALNQYAKQGNGYARITFLGYKDSELNGADPVLTASLVPVTIEDDGVVRKANLQKEWYNYNEKKWANAVVLINKTKTYRVEEIIPESNIESYFVWIPKYAYKIWDLGLYDRLIEENPPASIAREIEIRFGLNDTNDANTGECTNSQISGGGSNCHVGDFMTHPAFTAFNANGMWVAKFETTGSIDNLQSKPNQISLRNQKTGAMFNAAYNYLPNSDSHMMKNTEWGAVAYLSHSKYGINKEININNYQGYKTGYSAVEGTNQSDNPGTYGTTSNLTQPWNTETGYKASTTGNITGVYDMSGGAYEYVAAYRANSNFSSVNFSSDPATLYDSKYFDVYNENSSTQTYNYRILGDATGEMGPFYSSYRNNWYNDFVLFIMPDGDWFLRGEGYDRGVLAGQFNFNRSNGSNRDEFSFRLVLSNNARD